MRFALEFGGPKPEERSSYSLENPSVSLVDPKAWAQIFGDWRSAAGVSVDANVAMTVPAVWCAVNFLANTVASVPLKLHKKTKGAIEVIEGGQLAGLLSGQCNDDYLSSFNWRRDMMTSTLLLGRGLTFLEKAAAGNGDTMAMWPIELSKTRIKRRLGKTTYNYRDTTSSKTDTFTPGEIIDIKFLGKTDGVDHFDPVEQMKDTIGLAIAARTYASRFFLNGGVPPLALEGPAASPAATSRAKSDAGEAVKQSTRDHDNIVYLPPNHKLTTIGFNPEKSQLIETQNFVVQEVSRIYNLPPAFLHYLLNATFANVEQQDLAFVKHCLIAWIEQWEAELNIKLFGARAGRYVAFDLNGLLRGDFLSRMMAYTAGINGAVLKPNEARRRENLPDAEGGDRLFINSAAVPLDTIDDPATTGDPTGEQINPGDPEEIDPADPQDPVDPKLPEPTPPPEPKDPPE